MFTSSQHDQRHRNASLQCNCSKDENGPRGRSWVSYQVRRTSVAKLTVFHVGDRDQFPWTKPVSRIIIVYQGRHTMSLVLRRRRCIAVRPSCSIVATVLRNILRGTMSNEGWINDVERLSPEDSHRRSHQRSVQSWGHGTPLWVGLTEVQ